MKKKGFKLLIVVIVVGMVGMLAVLIIQQIMQARDSSKKNNEVKLAYFAIIANEDPNQVNSSLIIFVLRYKNVIYHFEEYLSALSPHVPLYAATAEHVEVFLKEREKILRKELAGETADLAIKETMEFNRKALEKLLETATKARKQKDGSVLPRMPTKPS